MAPYWWTSPIYPTGIALDVWALAGRPGPRPARVPTIAEGARSAFEQAWLVVIGLGGCAGPGAWSVPRALLDLQQDDGGWPSGRFLIVPGVRPAGPRQEAFGDSRRLLTTASATMALTRAARRNTLPSATIGLARRTGGDARATTHGVRSAAGSLAGQLIVRAARFVRFDGENAAAAQLFHELTRETFAEPAPWPSAQVSSLGAGVPLEFSVAGPSVAPALRYAAEVGHPLLPAPRRAASAVQAVSRAAGQLGYDAAWQRVREAVMIATSPSLPVPDRCRFWVWSGIDQPLGPAGQALPPRLKVYLSLLEAEVGGGRARLDRVLAAAGIPLPRETSTGYGMLGAGGFPHEVGFGLGPDGRIAVKVYYELLGWRPQFVACLLELLGLVPRAAEMPERLELLRPEIPGVLGERLAAKSRAGIAFRLDPETGSVRDLTTAAAFPPPLAGEAEVGRRILGWADRNGWRSEYAKIWQLLEREGRADGTDRVPDAETSLRAGMAAPLHSLLTRTVSREAAWLTIYLRPPLRGIG